jgi:uncharacterized membrane protein (UPF0136 family)
MNEQHYKAAFYATLAIVNFAIAWKNESKSSILSGMASGMFFALFIHATAQPK